ncbi:MAG TPA: SIS domain-containing protein [Solirubrobacteraceae bacterium]|nr:SIS domain-containing protein [Solirubrobacteraceae bacterium]
MTGGALMAADMAAQPEVLRGLRGRRPSLVAGVRSLVAEPPRGVVIVARGSSDYAAVFGRYVIEAATGRPPALAAPSLQTLYGVEPRLERWLAIAVSQSGRTPEIATVLEGFARAGARTVAVTNDAESPLARAADATVALGAGEEGAVPATKTFTASVGAFALIAEALGRVPWDDAGWAALPAAAEAVLADPEPAERAAAALAPADEVVCLARGYLLCVALEAALKLREAGGVRAEGWSSADYRHGPVTVAGADLPVVACSAAGPAATDTEALARELAERGTTVVRLCERPEADLPFPAAPPEPLAAIPAAVRAQQLALAVALRRGRDPDRPAGLRKVTPTR